MSKSNGKNNRTTNYKNSGKSKQQLRREAEEALKNGPIFEDDRPDNIKKIDNISKVIAIILTLLFFINVHVLFGGGGYENSKIVTVLGFSNATLEESAMIPEIPDKSNIITKVSSNYEVGDVVRFNEEGTTPVKRIVSIDETESGRVYSAKGDSEEEISQFTEDSIYGEVVFHTTFGHGFMRIYRTAIGAALTLLLSLFLVCLGDILMIPTRKAKLEEMRKKSEEKKKKESEKGKIEVADNTLSSKKTETGDTVEIVDLSTERKKKKQEKLEKDREHVKNDMTELQRQMRAEEEELQVMLKARKEKK